MPLYSSALGTSSTYDSPAPTAEWDPDRRNGTGRLIDVQGGYPHGTAYELTVNAWPALKSLPAPVDTDKDGMPDDWEKKHGLNFNDAADASTYTLNNHYTNIEVYLNNLVK